MEIAFVKSFLFDNKTLKQTIVKNTFWLGFAEGVTKILNLILFIGIARILGAQDLGRFNFALAFIGLFMFLPSFGLPRIIVREFSQNKEREKDFPSLLSLRMILSLFTFFLIFFSSFFITQDPFSRKLIWILAIFSLSDSFVNFFNFFFQARQKMEYEAFSKILKTFLVVSVGLFILFRFPSIENISYGYLTASIISLLTILLIFHLKILPLSLNLNREVLKKYIAYSLPLVFGGFFSIIIGQIDSVMMGYFKQITEVGWYQAAYRLMGGTLIPLGFISTSFYPVLTASFQESKGRFKNVFVKQVKIFVFFALFSVFLIIFAPWLIQLFYGFEFSPSIFALQLLLLVAGISYLTSPFTNYLLASKQERKLVMINLAGAFANVVLNLIFIPRYSLYGAAGVMVFTSLAIFLLSFFFTYPFLKKAYIQKLYG